MANGSLLLAQGKCKESFPDKGQLNSISDQQLIAIARCVRSEMKRRAQSRLRRELFLKRLEAEEDEFFDVKFRHGNDPNDVSVPRSLREGDMMDSPGTRLRYLRLVLMQDWSSLWTGCDETKKYCVYAHVNPTGKIFAFSRSLGGPSRMPFYIGKGTIGRAHDLDRNQGHGIKLRQLLSEGFNKGDVVTILKKSLSEAKAFELEAKLVYFFGTIYEKGRQGVLYNLDPCPRPHFIEPLRKIETIEPKLLSVDPREREGCSS